MSYTNWKSDILLSIFSLVPFFLCRNIFINETEQSSSKMTCILVGSMIWLALAMFLTHLAMMKICLDNFFLRCSNQELVDG